MKKKHNTEQKKRCIKNPIKTEQTKNPREIAKYSMLHQLDFGMRYMTEPLHACRGPYHNLLRNNSNIHWIGYLFIFFVKLIN